MLKRFCSVVLVIILVVCMVSSCDLIAKKDPAAIIKEAEAQTADHTVNIAMTFTSDDDDMKEAIKAIESSSFTLIKSGDDFKIDMKLSVGDVVADKSYIVVGNALYSVSEFGSESSKEKAQLTAAEKASVIKNAGVGDILSYDDFNEVSVESNGEVHLITCTDLKSDSAVSLVNVFESYFGDNADDVLIGDTELVIRIVDGKYNGIYLSSSYSISVDGVVYDIRMQAVREYDYTTPVSVEAPVDADTYALTPYSEIIK